MRINGNRDIDGKDDEQNNDENRNEEKNQDKEEEEDDDEIAMMQSYYEDRRVVNVLRCILSLVSTAASFDSAAASKSTMLAASALSATNSSIPALCNIINDRNNNNNMNPLELAIGLMQELSDYYGYDDYDSRHSSFNNSSSSSMGFMGSVHNEDNFERTVNAFDEDDHEEEEPATALIQRIESNDIAHLILRNIRIFDDQNHHGYNESSSSASLFRHFNKYTIRQATEALKRNHSIRSISCQYDLPRRLTSPSSTSSQDSSSASAEPTAVKSLLDFARDMRRGYNFDANRNNNLRMLTAAAAGTADYFDENLNYNNDENNSRSIVVSSILGYRNFGNINNNNNDYERSHQQRRYRFHNHHYHRGFHNHNNNNEGGENRDDDTRRHPTRNFSHAAGYNNYNTVTRYEERSLIEACVCLPRLESLSITGGNKGWKISHLITILESVKGLKRLKIHDIVIKSRYELILLQRCLLQLKERKDGLPLEEIDFIIEDQTTSTEEPDCAPPSLPSSSSLFDDLIGTLMVCPNLKMMTITKSMLSRLDLLLRPYSSRVDVSTRTLTKLATNCPSLSKLVFNGLSYQRNSIESMCNVLMMTPPSAEGPKQLRRSRFNQQQSQTGAPCSSSTSNIDHIEFTGCAFYHSVEPSDWNALFRLIKHDPKIQIVASSPIYQRRTKRTPPIPRSSSSTTAGDDDDDRVAGKGQKRKGLYLHDDGVGDDDDYYHSRRRLGTIQRPRHDFSFSLRDKAGTDRHFYNRGMEIEYVLQEAGFFRLLQQQQLQTRPSPPRWCTATSRGSNNIREDGSVAAKSSSSTLPPPPSPSTIIDWIDVMSKVKDDPIALFYILRENPALCCASA